MDLYLLDDGRKGFLLCTQIEVDEEQSLVYYHDAVELSIRPTREQAEFIYSYYYPATGAVHGGRTVAEPPVYSTTAFAIKELQSPSNSNNEHGTTITG